MLKKKLNHGSNNKGLFSANFEESSSIVEKSKIKEIVESVDIKLVLKWLIVNIGFILVNIMMCYVGYCIMGSINIQHNVISILNKVALFAIGLLIIFYIPQLIYSFFPNKKAYKFYITRILSSHMSAGFMCLLFILVMWSISASYSAILGFLLILGYIIFTVYTLSKEKRYYYQKLYSDTKPSDGFVQKFIQLTTHLSKKYGGWLIVTAVLLKSIFNNGHLGFFKSLEQGICAVICTVFSFVAIKLIIGISFSELIQIYYINKYLEEYRQLYDCSKKQWYGKKYKEQGA